MKVVGLALEMACLAVAVAERGVMAVTGWRMARVVTAVKAI